MNSTPPTPGASAAPGRTAPGATAPPPAAAAGRPPRGPRSQQWAARGFLAPVVIYLGAFYAYPHVHNDQEWNAIMATAVVASLPAAVILVLAQRYVAAGVTAGAVKG